MLFKPSIPELQEFSPLWRRMRAGLDLFKIPHEKVRLVTRFKLGSFQRRLNFHAEIAEGNSDSSSHSPPMAFVLGDSAVPVSFRAGRGLNTGIKGALSLAKCLNDLDPRRWRFSDFVQHEGYMHQLQQKELMIRSLKMMKVRNGLDGGDGGAWETVSAKVKKGIEKCGGLRSGGTGVGFEEEIEKVGALTD